MKFLLEVDRGPWTTPLNFYDDLDRDLDSGSGFSETTGWIFNPLSAAPGKACLVSPAGKGSVFYPIF